MSAVFENIPSYTVQSAMPASTISFANERSKWVFRINFETKTVELNDSFDWDDAGKLFWEHILKHAPAGFSIERKS